MRSFPSVECAPFPISRMTRVYFEEISIHHWFLLHVKTACYASNNKIDPPTKRLFFFQPCRQCGHHTTAPSTRRRAECGGRRREDPYL